MRTRSCVLILSLVFVAACSGDDGAATTDTGADVADGGTDAADIGTDAVDDTGDDTGDDAGLPSEVTVRVTLDGAPVADATVSQGGTYRYALTDASGEAVVPIDFDVVGDLSIVASHPDARTRSSDLVEGGTVVEIALTAFDRTDNPDYRFQDPGEPRRRPTTAQCGHCHQTIQEAWWDSPHRTAASNPRVHDLYAGAAASAADADACADLGGVWASGRAPGGGVAERCFVGEGVLEALNDCEGADCDAPSDAGACADCHAPGIDGTLGGRDLLEAEGYAHDYGVHCDVCHRVEDVVLDASAGVAGRLALHRPSEEGPIALGAGGLLPLSFGPSPDVPNPRMGVVPRDHYRDGSLCAGCHEQVVEPLVPGVVADAARWADGQLPIQTTYSEWLAGPFGEVVPCNACHMPPDPTAENTADLQRFPQAQIGLQGGWPRPPGQVRQHAWWGPRQPEAGMLQLAAHVELDVTAADGALVVDATTRNAGAGHAIPTGEPMRSIVTHVEVTCDGEAVPQTDGDVIPDFGGQVAAREAGDAWDLWPEARPGDRIRVLARTGEWYAYAGYGPFGDGTFTGEALGLPVERLVGEAAIVEVAADGTVTTDVDLPEGDVARLVRPDAEVGHLAGLAGFGFARVLVDDEGRRMVPHHLAADVVSDNRLMPQTEWTSTHRFEPPCAEPQVTAEVLYRPYAFETASRYGWTVREEVMARATWSPTPVVEATPPDPDGGDRVVELDLRAEAAPDGSPWLYAYNGQTPGPVIRAQVGDRLVVHLENALDAPTTIHWHGLDVPWAMDGVVWRGEPVAPGTTFTYAFELTQAGTFWYHPHFDTEQQVDGGLYGAIVVEDPAEPAADVDLVWVVDEAAEFGAPHAAHGHGQLATRWVVDGVETPQVEVPSGSVVRLRIVNASNHGYLALVGDDAWRQIGGDQGLLSAPASPDLLVLAPGDRVELEVRAGADAIPLVTRPWSLNGGEVEWDEDGLLATITPTGDASAPAPIDWPFDGATPTPDPGRTDVHYAFAGTDRTGEWFINGEQMPDVTVEELPFGTEAILEVQNLSATEHPFHLHGLTFEVLSVNGEAPSARVVEDTINLRIRDVVRLRVVADNPGDWMAHCHILPHADRGGMMTVLRVLEP